MEMLIYQNDYLTIDAQRHNNEEKKTSQIWFVITIQCNGKLRRSRFSVWMYENKESKWKWDTEDCGIIEVLKFIRDIWYDIPEWLDILNHAIRHLYPMDTKEFIIYQPLKDTK